MAPHQSCKESSAPPEVVNLRLHTWCRLGNLTQVHNCTTGINIIIIITVIIITVIIVGGGGVVISGKNIYFFFK